MVTRVNKTQTDDTIAPISPFVAELVGPAGAGKTTLSHALSRRSSRVLLDKHPYFRRAVDIPFFVKNSVLLTPTPFRLCQSNSRRPSGREIAWMVILRGWNRVLERRASCENSILVLDQGPVFLLGTLHEFGPASLQGHSLEKWWDRMYSQWAPTLDLIIWLDTSDAILEERIRARSKWHLVKTAPEPKVFEFLTRYRETYEHVISRLTDNICGPKVFRFDTAQQSLDEIVDRVLVEFGLKDGKSTVR